MDATGLTAGMLVGEAGAGEGYFTFPMARRVGTAGLVPANIFGNPMTELTITESLHSDVGLPI